ncbi:AAA family ATPase [Glycomyces paridis]|uniref:AAA family ATPase n=1 Tax=Glycomyces paridis TaxID=2126555 RepID=A0A4S8NVK2_9ACTN|nr:AAA family ATPase [Glycomyces paridis]THV21667.1 AAA family ATPase [Glycomyces paridis]
MPFSTAAESAYDTFSRGVDLLGRGDLVRASDCFEHVTEYDPAAADAWLGIHACGNERDLAVRKMLEHRDAVGRHRNYTGLKLESSYAIGKFVELKLSDAFDAWLAYIAGLLDAEEFDRAADALDAAKGEDDRIDFLRARWAFDRGDWQGVLNTAPGVDLAVLRDEAQFYLAASLVELGTFYEALDVTEFLPSAIREPDYEAHVAFVQGAALAGIGRKEEAARSFQRAYRLAPGNERFAEKARSEDAPSERKPLFGGDEPKDTDRSAMLDDAARQLDAMIGLGPVKEQVNTLKAQYRMAALKEARGLPSETRPHHFVFTGPPGTGKTTVARIMGGMLAGLGLLEHGRVVEAQRGDLVGGYLGHTAIKTRKKIDEATGGVLFIDEAYSLANQGYTGGGDAFGDEALQEILTAAENRRDELVIVLAGYTDEIRELLATNPGLRSRFSTVVDFPSYSDDELAAIATAILTAAGERLSGEAERSLRFSFGMAVRSGDIDALGNGRFARDLCAKATAQRDLRLLSEYGDTGTPTVAEMTTVEAADVASAYGKLTA